MVAGGVFGVMCLIIISLVTLLFVQIYKRYDRDSALSEVCICDSLFTITVCLL